MPRERLLAPMSHLVTKLSAEQASHRTLEKVFVVYGHDPTARTELEAMLLRWQLEPLIFDQLPSAGQTIIEKLEAVREQANFAVMLATPDDEGHTRNKPAENVFRARPLTSWIFDPGRYEAVT